MVSTLEDKNIITMFSACKWHRLNPSIQVSHKRINLKIQQRPKQLLFKSTCKKEVKDTTPLTNSNHCATSNRKLANNNTTRVQFLRASYTAILFNPMNDKIGKLVN